MFSTSARRAAAFSTTTRVYPPLPPMSGPSAFAARLGLRNAKLVPAVLAIGSIGYGVSAYRQTQLEKFHTQSAEMERLEFERRQQNMELMNAYGEASSLEDLEKAMAFYESHRKA